MRLFRWITPFAALALFFAQGCGGGSSGDRGCPLAGVTVAQLQEDHTPVTECTVEGGCNDLTDSQVKALDSNTQIFACGDVSGVCVGDGCNVGAGNASGPINNDSFNPVDNSADNSNTDNSKTTSKGQ